MNCFQADLKIFLGIIVIEELNRKIKDSFRDTCFKDE